MDETVTELEKLAKTGRYLFHGSPIRLEVIEPRQAYNNSRPDGPPTVAATTYYQLAIFRAIMLAVKPKVSPGQYQSGFSFTNGRLSFRASKETLAIARSNITGFVYVFDKSNFQKHSSMEFRSLKAVWPIKTLEVNSSDLPEEIAAID
jgi:hypothetical protein